MQTQPVFLCENCDYHSEKIGETRAHAKTEHGIGAKYLIFFSSRSLKTREKYISFSQFFLRRVCSLFNFE